MDSLNKLAIEDLAADVMDADTTAKKRDIVFGVATDIFLDRNAKYKDAWRQYRPGTFVDRNLVKAIRLRELDEAGDLDEVLEQALDQVNENLFLAILILEKKAARMNEASSN